MRNYFLAAFLLFGLAGTASAQGERQVLAFIGPAVSSQTVGGSFELLLSSSGAGVRNCITKFTIKSDTAYTFTIYNGGSSAAEPLYQQDFDAGAGVIEDFGFFTPLCGSANTEMYWDVSAGAYNLDYSGYKY